MTRYVGLDAHSKSCVYVIQDENGKHVGEGSVPTTLEGLEQMHARYDLPKGTRVALESGTMAFFVARRLTGLGLDPVVIDAHEVRAKALRPNQKSDRRDALELCEGLRRGTYRSVVHVPPQSIERLRETLGRRRHFVRVKTMQVNAVKRLLRGAGLPTLSRSLQGERGWDALLSAVAADPSLHMFCEAHRAVWRCAHEQIAELEESLKEQQRAFQRDVDRLQTVRRSYRCAHSAGSVLGRATLPDRQARRQLRRPGRLDVRLRRARPARTHHATRLHRTALDVMRSRPPWVASNQSVPPVLLQPVRASRLQDSGGRGGPSAVSDHVLDAAPSNRLRLDEAWHRARPLRTQDRSPLSPQESHDRVGLKEQLTDPFITATDAES
jgi:transposase